MLTHSSFIHRLDELAVHARQAVREEQRTNAALRSMPFCAFNGGRDVFVDVGSKDLGIASLQRIVGATPQSTLHMGDQFTLTGNDHPVRVDAVASDALAHGKLRAGDQLVTLNGWKTAGHVETTRRLKKLKGTIRLKVARPR